VLLLLLADWHVTVTTHVVATACSALANRQSKQTFQEEQQQQQQLPPDQQAELDNSLNVLGLALLRLWQHVAQAHVVYEEEIIAPTPLAEAAHEQRGAAATAHMHLVLYVPRVMWLAELAIRYWPAVTPGSSSSSRGTVQYGAVLLPKLAPVSSVDALAVGLATAQLAACCIDAWHNWELEPTLWGKPDINSLAGLLTLRLQLLLLACQAKQLKTQQLGYSEVPVLRPGAYKQQQQQEASRTAVICSRSTHMELPSHHDLLLDAYDLPAAVDLAALEQQQQQHLAGMHHMRWAAVQKLSAAAGCCHALP
jgi:hypothetical protein